MSDTWSLVSPVRKVQFELLQFSFGGDLHFLVFSGNIHRIRSDQTTTGSMKAPAYLPPEGLFSGL